MKEKFLLMCSVVQSCLTLCYLMDISPAGSCVCGIFQARILEQIVIFSPKGSSRPRDRTCVSCVSCIGRWIIYHCATWEAPIPIFDLSSKAISSENNQWGKDSSYGCHLYHNHRICGWDQWAPILASWVCGNKLSQV